MGVAPIQSAASQVFTITPARSPGSRFSALARVWLPSATMASGVSASHSPVPSALKRAA